MGCYERTEIAMKRFKFTSGGPGIVVLNLHRRFTGISATIKSIVPHQRRELDIAIVDIGNLELGGEYSIIDIAIMGFTNSNLGKFRVWHARRDIDMILGILLRDIFRQRWRVVFTSAANRRPGRVLRWLINKMDAVIVTSEHNIQFLDWYTAIIQHGVDTEIFEPEKFYGKAAADPGGSTIGFVGRIRPLKGADLFVEAMIQIIREYPDCSAVLAGLCRPKFSEFEKKLRDRIKSVNLEKRIVFLGELKRTALIQLYRQMDICVTPSRVEGFGLVPLEALACGTPVVTSDTGAWPWIVNSEVGGVARAGDLESLTEEIQLLLSDRVRLRKMRVAARQRVVMHYSIESEANALNQLYRQLMSGRPIERIIVETSSG